MITEPLSDRELILLEEIEQDPDITQASLAAQLGVAVGTVNWHIKRLISKGYVKVKRAQRRKLRYIITPEGLAFRAALAVNYLETSMRMYRNTRQRVRDLLIQIHQAGYNQVVIDGEGDIGDICRLTCLEQGIRVVDSGQQRSIQNIGPIQNADTEHRIGLIKPLPTLEVRGTKILLRMDS